MVLSNRKQAVADLENFDKIAQHHDENKFVQQAVSQIPWGHNILIFSKSKNIKVAHFYLLETIENGWSRDVLDLQIKSQSHL
jgi:predicted nuclease of restriction endonuclease-like (RecB) superfamily